MGRSSEIDWILLGCDNYSIPTHIKDKYLYINSTQIHEYYCPQKRQILYKWQTKYFTNIIQLPAIYVQFILLMFVKYSEQNTILETQYNIGHSALKINLYLGDPDNSSIVSQWD